MMISAMLLMAILGPTPQDAPAAARPPKRARKAAKPAATAAAEADSAAATAAAAPSGGSASDEIHAGLTAFGKRRFSDARAAFERAVAADPQSAAAHYYLGYTIYKIAEPKRHDSPGKKEAAAEFAKAYELDPGFKPVWGSRRG
jgi:tetratricopeptide (TPR) repeat protein